MRLRVVCLMLLLQAALLLRLSPTRPLHASLTSRTQRARAVTLQDDAEASGEEAQAATDDPKASVKAEKKALRDAIAEIEAKLPKARGELVSALDAAKDAGENGYMLLAANFERARVQAREELKSQKGYGQVTTLRSLVNFIETFDALQAEATDGDEDGPAAIHKYYGGIYKQFQQLLDSWAISSYDAVAGEVFDAKKHQAVERVPSDDVPEGTIIESVGRGYMMENSAVRLAKCVVSLGAAVEEEAEEEAADAGSEATEATAEEDGEAAA